METNLSDRPTRELEKYYQVTMETLFQIRKDNPSKLLRKQGTVIEIHTVRDEKVRANTDLQIEVLFYGYCKNSCRLENDNSKDKYLTFLCRRML